MNRRNFIKTTALTSLAAGTVLPGLSFPQKEEYTSLRIGLCADLHHDLIFDSTSRLGAFIDDMMEKKTDLIVQLGDFCYPDPGNRAIMDVWNRFPGPGYHVIGNHDPEGEFTQDEVVEFWQMQGKYYSFDLKGYHFVVLNGNERNPAHETPRGYARFISARQLEWLEDDLRSTELPTIVFCHQGLDNEVGVENAQRIRLAFEDANSDADFRKVQVVFTGHHHKDYHNMINGIHYIQINSMSYHWQGNAYVDADVFSEALKREFPYLRYMAYYQDPLWAVADISEDGVLHMQGRQTTFVGRSPTELGMPLYDRGYPVVPFISDRKIQLTEQAFAREGCL